jgi:serine/threonine protein kinase
MTCVRTCEAGIELDSMRQQRLLCDNFVAVLPRCKWGEMIPERFKRLADLFPAALAKATGEAVELEDSASPGDQALEAEVAQVLPWDPRRNAPPLTGERTATATMDEDRYAGRLFKSRYQLDEMIGRGGFGVVYRGRDTGLHDKPVVIKILLDHVDRAWFLRKFAEECKALARIRHPGVVGILDQGETPERTPFLVMEFVEGETLQSAIGEGRMELARVGRLIQQIGAALGAAHNQGVCHRDLKPANIVLRDLGRGQEMAVIIDFGVATVTDNPLAASSTTRVTGSHGYMAPEQYLGRPEPASDIYSLGVVAYEMITGVLPFDEETPVALHLSQKEGIKIKPRRLRPELSEAAERVILKALAYDPKNRYSHPTEFAERLSAVLADGDKSGRVFSVGGLLTRRRAAGLGAIGVAGLTAWIVKPILHWPATADPAPPDRTMNYYVVVQKYRNGRPFQEPFPLAKEMLFPPDYRVRIMFNSLEAGYLYLINESPATNEGSPAYNLLFPSIFRNSGSALLQPNQEIPIPSEKDYFVLDREQGDEKVWLIWAKESVPEMEAVKSWVNPRDRGRIKDPLQTGAVKQFLAHHAARPPRMEKDEKNVRTVVRGPGNVLVALLHLQHD